ncbi:serine hydrolase domain-containing protein [Heyndrickxia shackletonii]|uniref:serine hydrolase domain-containing protein n=2 Tax=Bacillaceae TaxID=186817 RepID=UPI001F41DA63|nr:serine hydrolase domain-containing protein [Heyndrickxia shackletonii]
MVTLTRASTLKRRRAIRKRRIIGTLMVFCLLILLLFGAIYSLFHKKGITKATEQKHQTESLIRDDKPNITAKKNAKTNHSPKNIVKSKEIDDYLKSIHFNGTAVVVKNGQFVINKGYGFANREKQAPDNPNTIYYIGSITKSFVSASFMQLQEKGLVNTNDLLSKYLPSFPHANEIKIYNLLTHTSGIREHMETSEKLSREQLMKKIGKGAQTLLFKPGTQWNYSDSNYAILGYIIEKVTGESLHDYIRGHIFKPAQMKDSGFGEALYHSPNQSIGYKLKDNSIYTPGMPDFSQLFGCGDIYTTASDLYKFDLAIESGKLFSKDSFNQIYTPNKSNYGFGWYVDPGSYSSHGVMPGWNTLNSYSKSGNIYVVLLSNIQNNIQSMGVVNNNIYMKLANFQGS